MTQSIQTNDNSALLLGLAYLASYALKILLGLILIKCCTTLCSGQNSPPEQIFKQTVQQLSTNTEIQKQTTKKVLRLISQNANIEVPPQFKKIVRFASPLSKIREISPIPGTRKVPKSGKFGFPMVYDWAEHIKNNGNRLPWDLVFDVADLLKASGYGEDIIHGYMSEVGYLYSFLKEKDFEHEEWFPEFEKGVGG